jgi:hypothetical protein
MSSRSLRRCSTAATFTTALLLAVSAPVFADAPPPTNGGNGAGQNGQCTGTPPTARPPAAPSRPASSHGPRIPGWRPWPILALAVTPTCCPRSQPQATCHSAKHPAPDLTKAELPRRPQVREVG